ncbi:unnamed protein product [Haemonchus placei]|uniref:Ras-associating domain-containing protein n=1 Tax=Haemonchus placei TaxID=6290 RepID=A0A0N4W1D5_HAEPC|nr:unnamed protein product [Haemonchus placei]
MHVCTLALQILKLLLNYTDPRCDRTPLELIYALAKGSYDPEFVLYADEDASQDRSLPPAERLSLRIASR